ncbi:MAG: hypothetical protein EZS28_034240 [Streblomastix strix]|uniref:RecF/RecN/SMC N-terminal domain-containing protein n=1 Tax=Streblomastix strix TaxID=222440 RepID=A0A5J4UJ45_9EUKA|nr:MAG: hypothetical protein EZS28_034240 [Streblomastix strix]
MIGLESIILHNFKSYNERVTIKLGRSHFATVIGANGSGKSNFIDAVLFGLGHRSSDLRGDNLLSLLNSNCSQKGEHEGSVTLSFVLNCNDQIQNIESHRIIVKRVFNESKSQFYIKLPLSHDDENHDKKKSRIRPDNLRRVSREALNQILKTFGLDIDQPERYALLQNQTHTFAAKSPQSLARYLEDFIGNGEIVTRILEKQQFLCGLQQNQVELRRDYEV